MSDRDAAGSRRTLLPAVVGPAAAFVMWRDLSRWFEDKAQMFSAHPQTAEVARQLVLAAAQLQEAGNQWQVARAAAASEGGRSEVPIGADAPSSSGVLLDGRRLLGTGQVAEMLRVTPRRVVQMIDEEKLSATPVGGRWWIDETSAVLMAEGREHG